MDTTFYRQSVSILREGHSHGMTIAFYNLFIGLSLGAVSLSNGLKKTAAIAGLLSFFLPIGLALKGAAGTPMDFLH